MKILSVFSLLLIFSFSNEVRSQETKFTTSDGVELYANIKGDGIPCLFIHGGPGQGSNYWEALAGDLGEEHFKMIYLDQRGCGRSTSPTDANYSIDRMLLDFEEVRKQLKIDEWMIMGHSFGGVLQTYYASRYPEYIKGIMMFNCTLDLAESVENSYLPTVVDFFNIEDTSYLLNSHVPLAERLDSIQKLFATRTDVWKLSFSSIESATKFEQSFAGFETWNMDFARAALSINDYMTDYAPLSSEIQIPTLFVYATEDKNVGVDHYKKAKFPNLVLVKINGGHMEFIDNSEDYAEAVDQFLQAFYE